MEINEATAVTICAREQNKKGDNISYKEVTVLKHLRVCCKRSFHFWSLFNDSS